MKVQEILTEGIQTKQFVLKWSEADDSYALFDGEKKVLWAESSKQGIVKLRCALKGATGKIPSGHGQPLNLPEKWLNALNSNSIPVSFVEAFSENAGFYMAGDNTNVKYGVGVTKADIQKQQKILKSSTKGSNIKVESFK